MVWSWNTWPVSLLNCSSGSTLAGGRNKCGWFLFLSLCVCSQKISTALQTAACTVIAVYQAVLGTKSYFPRVLNSKKETRSWPESSRRQTLKYKLECEVCKRSVGPSVYAKEEKEAEEGKWNNYTNGPGHWCIIGFSFNSMLKAVGFVYVSKDGITWNKSREDKHEYLIKMRVHDLWRLGLWVVLEDIIISETIESIGKSLQGGEGFGFNMGM